jgi:hypothetical protein
MGTWGPGIFSGDLASDIRGLFREMIGDGLSAEAATEALIKDFSSCISDPDEGPVFWMALAATQWQCGRLLPEVREKSIAAVDAGGDLHLWQESRLLKKRKAALAKLRGQLLHPQRRPTCIKKAYHYQSDWETGDIVAYKTRSEKWVLFRIVDMTEGRSRVPAVELYDWCGEQIPPLEHILDLPIRETRHFAKWNPATKGIQSMRPSRRMAIYALSSLARFQSAGSRLSRRKLLRGSYRGCRSRTLEVGSAWTII